MTDPRAIDWNGLPHWSMRDGTSVEFRVGIFRDYHWFNLATGVGARLYAARRRPFLWRPARTA